MNLVPRYGPSDVASGRRARLAWASLALLIASSAEISSRASAGGRDSVDWRVRLERIDSAEVLFLDPMVHAPLLAEVEKSGATAWRDALQEGDGVTRADLIPSGEWVAEYGRELVTIAQDRPGEAKEGVPLPPIFSPDMAAIVSSRDGHLYYYVFAETETGRVRILDDDHVLFSGQRDPGLVASAMMKFSFWGVVDGERRRIAAALDAQTRATLEAPTSVKIYAIDPVKYEEPDATWKPLPGEAPLAETRRRLKEDKSVVLGSVELRRPAVRIDLARRAMRAVTTYAPRMMCFDPRHALEVEGPGGPVVVVMCFACGQAYVFTPRGVTHTPLASDGSLAWTLNGILRRHGIDIAK